ncbi:aldo/keto reductase [Yinghuangia seranimata]|uniref:aldo/keto reductase n=1 Tax=Yinghuangia seranimata TaxID=408067 RepID=UPI00248B76F3|nr:aldo/keto reductase [Yinghuangia seranimata]MDI2128668.1 aldo/keto reductase [Yinghuangia seranimata]
MRYLDVEGFPRISRIGLGTWQFGSRQWGYGDAYDTVTARALVGRALELGVTLFDTAEVYGRGASERILGEALGSEASRVVVATKFAPVLPLAPITRARARASLGRLGVERISLYQAHFPNPLFGMDTVMQGLAELRDQKLVDEVGVSNYDLARWRRAEHALGHRVLSNQVEFSLVRPGPARDLVPWAAEHGRVVIAYSPLGQGLLGCRYDAYNPPSGFRARRPLFRPDNLRRATPLLELLQEVAAVHGASPGQVALAWVLRHGPVVAIPGASSVEQLEQNVAAAELDLTDDEFAALSECAAAFSPLRRVGHFPVKGGSAPFPGRVNSP